MTRSVRAARRLRPFTRSGSFPVVFYIRTIVAIGLVGVVGAALVASGVPTLVCLGIVVLLAVLGAQVIVPRKMQ